MKKNFFFENFRKKIFFPKKKFFSEKISKKNFFREKKIFRPQNYLGGSKIWFRLSFTVENYFILGFRRAKEAKFNVLYAKSGLFLPFVGEK